MNLFTKILVVVLVLMLSLFQVSLAHENEDPTLISPKELLDHIRSAKVVDIRSEEAYLKGHIPNALSLPQNMISEKSLQKAGVEKWQSVVIYSEGESESREVKKELEKVGYDQVRILAGGVQHWISEGYKLLKK